MTCDDAAGRAYMLNNQGCQACSAVAKCLYAPATETDLYKNNCGFHCR